MSSNGGDAKKIFAYIWFDVEDYVTPESNDVPLKAVEVLKRYKVPVTMKLVAEKVRFMKEQKRKDVISAIKDYVDVGYHTDTHSRHPIVFQYIAKMDVMQGAKEIEKRERLGLRELKRTFGQPSCFGHAGSQWAPHYYPFLKKNGIRVYLDATEVVNIDDSPYWYCGVLSLNNTDKNFIKFDGTFKEPGGWEELKKNFESIHDRLKLEGGGAISILWHPHTGVNMEFWDALNFPRGKNTPKGRYVLPKQYPAEVKERAIQFFENLVKLGSEFDDVQFISGADALRVYPRKLEMVLDPEGVRKIADALSGSEISFFKLDGEYISPAQAFSALVNFVAGYAKNHKIPKRTALSEPLGPMSPFKSKISSGKLRVADVLLASQRVSRFLAKGYMPSSVKVGKSELEPSDFLATLADLSIELLSTKTPASSVSIRRAKMILSEKFVDEKAFATACEWIILPPGFKAPKILEQAKLQTWTLVPAVAR